MDVSLSSESCTIFTLHDQAPKTTLDPVENDISIAPSTLILSINHVREKIFASLDVPDLIACAHVSKSWKKSSESIYSRNEINLCFEFLQSLQVHINRLDPERRTTLHSVLENLKSYLASDPREDSFKQTKKVIRLIQRTLIQEGRKTPKDILSRLEYTSEYLRKPYSLSKIFSIVHAYDTTDLLKTSLPLIEKWQEAAQTITKYNWRDSLLLLQTIPEGDCYHAIEEKIISTMITKGLHTSIIEGVLQIQHQQGRLPLPLGFHKPFEPEKELQNLQTELPTILPKKERSQLLVKIAFLQLLLDKLPQAIETTENIQNYKSKNSLLMFIISHMFAHGELTQIFAFIATTSIHRPKRREVLLIAFITLSIEHGFFPTAIHAIENLSSTLKPTFQSLCAKEMLQVGLLEEAKELLLPQEEMKKQPDEVTPLSEAYLRAGLLEEALKITLLLPMYCASKRDTQLEKIALVYKQRGQYQEALRCIDSIKDPMKKSLQLKDLASSYSQKNDIEGAHAIAKQIPLPLYKTEALSMLFALLQQESNYEKAQEIALEIPLEPQRSTFLGGLLMKQFPNTRKVLEIFPLIQIDKIQPPLQNEILESVSIVTKLLSCPE